MTIPYEVQPSGKTFQVVCRRNGAVLHDKVSDEPTAIELMRAANRTCMVATLPKQNTK